MDKTLKLDGPFEEQLKDFKKALGIPEGKDFSDLDIDDEPDPELD